MKNHDFQETNSSFFFQILVFFFKKLRNKSILSTKSNRKFKNSLIQPRNSRSNFDKMSSKCNEIQWNSLKFSPSASAGFCRGIKKNPHTRKAVLIVNSHFAFYVFSLLNPLFRRFPPILVWGFFLMPPLPTDGLNQLKLGKFSHFWMHFWRLCSMKNTSFLKQKSIEKLHFSLVLGAFSEFLQNRKIFTSTKFFAHFHRGPL